MVAPFRGFMRDPQGNPIIALGKTIGISISLEASQQLAPPPANSWASDTGDPILGYYLSPYPEPQLRIAPAMQDGHIVLTWANGATGMVLKQSSSLTNPDWQTVTGSDTTNRVELTIETGNAYFRLEEP
jgi:hypothetical protein